jgi:hypothetical protein
MTITASEIIELIRKKYPKSGQSKLARDMVAVTGCQERNAILTIHRLTKAKKIAPLSEVAIKHLTEVKPHNT